MKKTEKVRNKSNAQECKIITFGYKVDKLAFSSSSLTVDDEGSDFEDAWFSPGSFLKTRHDY